MAQRQAAVLRRTLDGSAEAWLSPTRSCHRRFVQPPGQHRRPVGSSSAGRRVCSAFVGGGRIEIDHPRQRRTIFEGVLADQLLRILQVPRHAGSVAPADCRSGAPAGSVGLAPVRHRAPRAAATKPARGPGRDRCREDGQLAGKQRTKSRAMRMEGLDERMGTAATSCSAAQGTYTLNSSPSSGNRDGCRAASLMKNRAPSKPANSVQTPGRAGRFRITPQGLI